MRSSNRQRLWKDSQLAMNYVTPEHSFSKQRRFSLYSIYWPQKSGDKNNNINKNQSGIDQIAKKVSKLIDQQEKNQMRMNKTQKTTMRNLSTAKGFGNKKQTAMSFRSTNYSNTNKKQIQIINRLTLNSHKKQSKLRDKYGFRNPLFIQPEDTPDHQQNPGQNGIFGSSLGFRTSRRINLILPHNFYPGPGTYEIKRYLEDSNEHIAKININE